MADRTYEVRSAFARASRTETVPGVDGQPTPKLVWITRETAGQIPDLMDAADIDEMVQLGAIRVVEPTPTTTPE